MYEWLAAEPGQLQQRSCRSHPRWNSPLHWTVYIDLQLLRCCQSNYTWLGFRHFLLILFCASSIIARVLRHLALVDRTPAPLAYLTLPSVKRWIQLVVDRHEYKQYNYINDYSQGHYNTEQWVTPLFFVKNVLSVFSHCLALSVRDMKCCISIVASAKHVHVYPRNRILENVVYMFWIFVV